MASGEKSKEAAPRPGGPGGTRGMLSLDDLRKEAGEEGTIDTIVTAFTDMQGRLFGKRIEIEYFLDEVTGHGVEGCNYLLALDMDMEPLPGYEMANWEDGYGDFGIQPDMSTLRRIPWLDRTALVLADVVNEDGSPGGRLAPPDPDRRLRAAREMGFTPYAASELEFYLYKESYAEAWEKDFKDLTPTIPYILDYHILATTMDEAYLGPIRRGMHGAGIPIEFSKGEAWYGQHEVNTRYADAVTAADRHTIYKNGVKEIAFLNDISASFMAKPSEDDIGSSCHIHQSLVDEDGKSVFVDGDGEETDTFMHFIGGMRNHIRELALFVAPAINSYKRYAAESWAPTSVSWGRDNRTCGFRVVGHGSPAGSSAGSPAPTPTPIWRSPPCSRPASTASRTRPIPGPELKGNAYEAGEAEAFPSSLREAVDLWEKSDFAKKAFGDAVHKHYLNYGQLEQGLFDKVVTDYERRRMFERG